MLTARSSNHSSRQSSIRTNDSLSSSKRNSLFGGRHHPKPSPSPSTTELGHHPTIAGSNSTADSSPILSHGFATEPEPLLETPVPAAPAPAPTDVSPAPGPAPAPSGSSPLERITSTASTASSDSFHSAHTFSEPDVEEPQPQKDELLLASSSAEPAPLANDKPPPAEPVARHVLVARRAMDEPYEAVQPLGKPLGSLTAQDVAMTEESMAEVSSSGSGDSSGRK